jgi:hypothetical protein
VYFNDFEAGIKETKSEINKDFSKVLTHVREVIYNQKFTGAAAGFLNPNIIARDLGLVDKAKVEHDIPPDSELVAKARRLAEDIANGGKD